MIDQHALCDQRATRFLMKLTIWSFAILPLAMLAFEAGLLKHNFEALLMVLFYSWTAIPLFVVIFHKSFL